MGKPKYIKNLSDEEWSEIVTLEYVLTWRYTDDYDRDLKRYKELSASKNYNH